jgi:hypothetical protein
MKVSKKHSVAVAAALTGLLGGTASRATAASGTYGNSNPGLAGQPAGITLEAKKEKHACKGQNSCKGKGGCKTGDNGCKAKNSCKGKGGCATDGSKPPA